MRRVITILILLTTPAVTAEITDQAKRDALMRAYHMNGDSMVGWGSIDLDIIKTAPVVAADEKNSIDAMADPKPNTCERHGMKKIQFRKRWRCRR